MSEWNDAIELAAQYCDKMARESRGVAMVETAHKSAAANIRLLKKKVMPKEPAVGRLVHVMIRRGDSPGLHLRPAIITRVGAVHVNDVEFPREAGHVGLQVFLAPEDYGDREDNVTLRLDALYSPEGGEWKEGTWRWISK